MESKATSTKKVNSFNFKTNKRQKIFNLYILKIGDDYFFLVIKFIKSLKIL